MKTISLLIIFSMVWSISFTQNHPSNNEKKKELYDTYGRKIQTEDGGRIIYSYSETKALEEKARLSASKKSYKQDPMDFLPQDISYCRADWEYAIMGTSIGRRSLNVYDLNNDGTQEIICSAQPSGFYGGNWGYWYIMKYNEITQEYEHVWVSDVYGSYIRRITLADINNNGTVEILVGFNNGWVLIYNSITKEIIGQITIPTENPINDIQVGDADNDDALEIAISDNSNIYFYSTDFSYKSQIPYGCFDFRIGNVDSDEALEIVTSKGKVLMYDGISTTVKWTFDSDVSNDYKHMVELSDINNDGKKEIIRAKDWYYIDVYDADIMQQKYQIQADLDVDALLLFDTNGNGRDEIIYGSGQWGKIYCIDALSQTQLWEMNKENHGTTGIAIADVTNNGTLEVLWGSGWTSSGADNLYVASIDDRSLQWESIHIDGPFYAIAIDDIDNDGVKEIVTISHESNNGYRSGIISVFNAETYELEWQSDENFLESVRTGIYDVKIHDINNDGVKDIIVAAGRLYSGKIWIIDGVTKEITSSHLYDNENEFYALSVAILDGSNGDAYIITANRDHIYVINPSNSFSVLWKSPNLSGYTMPSIILTGNIDDDSHDEIVVCKGNIYVIDGVTYQEKWESNDADYTTLDLFDYTNDGRLEIVAGTSNGDIVVIDGVSFEPIKTVSVSNSAIDGIKVDNYKSNSEPVIFFTSNGSLHFYVNGSVKQHSQSFGEIAGKHNGLKLYDTNNDGRKQIFLGTSVKVMEIPSSYYDCILFNAEGIIEDASCDIEDGSIELSVSGGTPPYSYSWSTDDTGSAINNLSSGTYTVNITDSVNCSLVETFTVKQSVLITNYTSTNVSCNEPPDGSATLLILEGTPPYSYNWSNGESTPSVTNLSSGTYTVTIVDSKNCSSTETILIEQDTIVFAVDKEDITCFGLSNGFVSTSISSGTPPYSYLWSNGDTTSHINNLAAGDYSVTITDNSNCSDEISVTVGEPTEIQTQITATPDDPSTPFGEGSATINAIGGSPAYSISWDDSFLQTGLTAINLLAGTYIATVIDANNCQKTDTVEIGYLTDTTEADHITDTTEVDHITSTKSLLNNLNINLYPNPTRGILNLKLTIDGEAKANVQIVDLLGRVLHSERFLVSGETIKSINISDLESGLYIVSLNINHERSNYFIELIK